MNKLKRIIEEFKDFEWKATNLLRHHRERPLMPENLASHLWVTGMLALKINPNITRDALIYMLTHDLGELATGDLASPIKDKYNLRETLDAIEADYNPYSQIEITEDDKIVLKLADQIAFLLFADEERSRGNSKYDDKYIRTLDLINQVNKKRSK